jgi:hypothetical protein
MMAVVLAAPAATQTEAVTTTMLAVEVPLATQATAVLVVEDRVLLDLVNQAKLVTVAVAGEVAEATIMTNTDMPVVVSECMDKVLMVLVDSMADQMVLM